MTAAAELADGPPARVLVTAFEPFGGDPVNASQELARSLASDPPPDGVELRVTVLPVLWDGHPGRLERALEEARPDAVLALGQAAREQVELELSAVNALAFGDVADNGGFLADGQPVLPDAPERLETALPLDDWCAALAREGLPVRPSRDAGRHLCNATLMLLLARRPDLPSLFAHVPLTPTQARRRGRGEPGRAPATSLAALRRVLVHLARATRLA